MTETKNFKLKKPEYNDPADIQVLNDNFDIIDEHLGTGSGGAAPYIIDLFDSVKIDFSQESEVRQYPLDGVNVAELMEAYKNGSAIKLKVGRLDTEYSFTVELDGVHMGSEYPAFNGVSAYSEKAIVTAYIWINSVYSVGLACKVVYMGSQEEREHPISMDMTNYEAGKIRLTYANDEAMDVSVEFDANGNPIRFSNGTEEFTVTWPEEVATDE